ncbi:cytochrome c [uncultured Mucilaginibacter sp.]|uniref:c-type cytochrome n=1 Tax=uncultured Mucilaginibacter sp. TaxID=797541 RepID=UPI0025FFE1F2|nr:cytochrome c [uncultured Mucilaginibacter sp.]
MKKLPMHFTLKPLLAGFFLTALFALSSCGNKETANTESTEAPKSMIADAPKDDGPGLGRFKNITLAAMDKKVAVEGHTIFESKCSACHNPTEVKKVGPGLKGVTQRRQPAWILNMITNPAEMTQKDPTAKDLLAQHLTQMTFQDVSDEQAKKILEFLRDNDAGGAEVAKK